MSVAMTMRFMACLLDLSWLGHFLVPERLAIQFAARDLNTRRLVSI
jgi:hypothetical protein